MPRMAISTAYMCFRSASEAVYSCMSASASSRVMALVLGCLGISCGQRHPAGPLTVEADLERVLTGARQGHIEYQDRSGLDINDAGRRLTELHRALASEELVARLVDKTDSDRVDADLGAASA